MEYRDRLTEDDAWDVFESALEDAVQNYVESLQEHLTDEYSNYNISFPDIDSDEEFLEILGLNNYSLDLKASDGNLRSYDIQIPDIQEPLTIEVERTVGENTHANDESREVVAYTLLPRSEHDRKFKNIQSEFFRLTEPDTVKENSSLFYREAVPHPLRILDTWESLDEHEVMEDASQRFEDNLPADIDFDIELGYDSGKDWRIYEFDFEDIDEILHLEVTLRNRGFLFNWKPDDYNLRYKNFVRDGFAEAIDHLND